MTSGAQLTGCLNSFFASISGALPGLGCQTERQRREVGVIGCYAVKARVWTSAIIKVQVAADAGVADAFVGPQIHVLIFNAAPQPLDEHVVPAKRSAVHADGDPVFDQHAGERRAGELAALIGVEDLRLAMAGESSPRACTGAKYVPTFPLITLRLLAFRR